MRRCLILVLAACSGAPATKGTEPGTLDQQWNRHFGKGETGPAMCAAAGLDKACKIDADCSMVDDILDRCGTTAHLGVATRAAFEPHDPCADQRCPLCVVRWSFTEDCAAGQHPVVACTNGRCMTHDAP